MTRRTQESPIRKVIAVLQQKDTITTEPTEQTEGEVEEGPNHEASSVFSPSSQNVPLPRPLDV